MNSKGNILRKLGRHAEALEAYDKALEFDSKHAKAWYNKGYIMAELGNYQKH